MEGGLINPLALNRTGAAKGVTSIRCQYSLTKLTHFGEIINTPMDVSLSQQNKLNRVELAGSYAGYRAPNSSKDGDKPTRWAKSCKNTGLLDKEAREKAFSAAARWP